VREKARERFREFRGNALQRNPGPISKKKASERLHDEVATSDKAWTRNFVECWLQDVQRAEPQRPSESTSSKLEQADSPVTPTVETTVKASDKPTSLIEVLQRQLQAQYVYR